MSPTVWMTKTVRQMRNAAKVHVVVINAKVHFQKVLNTKTLNFATSIDCCSLQFMMVCVHSLLALVPALKLVPVIVLVLLLRSAAAMDVDIAACLQSQPLSQCPQQLLVRENTYLSTTAVGERNMP